MISFDCQCGKPFRFSLKFRGREFRCNECGRPLIVPEESQPSAKTGVKRSASVSSGEIITPVKPVLQIDLGSLPAGTSMKNVPAQRKENQIDESEDDEIIVSGSLSKVQEEKEEKNVFHIDLDINESDEKDATSVILSKAAISQQVKEKQEQTEAAKTANVVLEQTTTKKAGRFSVFSKKKPAVPKTTDVTDDDQSQPIPVQKNPKTPATEKEKVKKAGFFSGLFKKKPVVPKTTDVTDDDQSQPILASKKPKTPALEKEKAKKTGFFSGLFKKKPVVPKIADALDSDSVKSVPAPEKTKKGKTTDMSNMQSPKNDASL